MDNRKRLKKLERGQDTPKVKRTKEKFRAEMLAKMYTKSPEEAEISNLIALTMRFGGGIEDIDKMLKQPALRLQIIKEKIREELNKIRPDKETPKREFFG